MQASTSLKSYKSRKSFCHSTTFYRKLKLKLKENTNTNCESTNTLHPVVTEAQCGSNKKLKTPEPAEAILEELTESESNSSSYTETFTNVYFYESEEETSEINKENIFKEQLREWALLNRETHTSVNHLLKILRDTIGISSLPCDSRTLLDTPKNIKVIKMGNGYFWYNGLKRNLSNIFSNIKENVTLPLIFNVDGLPPFNSSSVQLWPILCSIKDMTYLQPIVIAIYCGDTKPPLSDFFFDFVTEMHQILNNGIICNGFKIEISISYFVCDTPARSFVKGTCGFNSFNGCLKCTCSGEYDKKGRHMSFPSIDSPLRTDSSFRNKLDEDHHKIDSPLLNLPINMVEDFIIADSLHLLDLGIMRKCLNGWVHGSYNFKSKLSARQINLLSETLEECNSRRPYEIHRKIRHLKCIKHWKGSEFHVFLCYLGLVVLKDVITVEYYNHFLALTCAVTILSCDLHLKFVHVAEQLIKDYIKLYIVLYGRDSVSSNVHNLCHIVKDVKKFGNLSKINAYSFENYLGKLKLLIRTGNKPLQQIANRVRELEQLNNIKNKTPIPVLKNEIYSEKHDLVYCKKVFKIFEFGSDFLLSSNLKDKWFLTKENKIVAMINGTYWNDLIYIYGSELETQHDFFELPIKSSHLGIFESNGFLINPKLYALNQIKCKLFSIKYKSNFVFVPLLHSLDINIKY